MKISKITAAVAATIAAGSYAVTINDITSDYHNTATSYTDGSIVGVSAIAIAADRCVIESLQKFQGIVAPCIGNMDAMCAPSLSSAVIIGFLNGSWTNATELTNGSTTVADFMASCSPAITKTSLRRNFHGVGSSYVESALGEFINSSPPCLGSSVLAPATIRSAAATLTALNVLDNKGDIAFIHAGDLDSNTYADVGFIKLNNIAPSLDNLVSSKYDLVQNVYINLPGVLKTTHTSMTVGDYPAGPGVTPRVAWHHLFNVAFDCTPLSL